jgi:DNA invertase Pin-like site-specific DNA recombinase
MGAAALPRAIGILRVSRQNRNEDSRESPDVQRRLITRFAGPQGQGWDLIEILDENELRNGNVSGGGDISKRLGFSAAIKRIEAGKADLIVVADHGRLFRDIDVQRAAIDRVEGAGGQLWAVSSGQITHETADAELMANLKGSIDHYQRRYAREKSFLAVELAIEKGKVPWPGEIPGYIRDADSRLTPDDERVAVIVRAFEIRKDGGTIDAVRAHLLANGIEISYTATQHLLGDRIYLGEIHFGTHTPNLGACTPIIGRELFGAVQRTKISRGRRAKSDRLLARIGVLRCGNCGSRMVVGTSNSANYHVYRCQGSGCVQRMTILAETVERMVIEKVEELRACRVPSVRGECDPVEQARLDLERAQAALDGAIMAFSGLEVEPAAIRRLRELREGRDAAQERYVAREAAYAQSDFAATTGPWDSLSLQEQRDLVRALIKQVLITPGRGRQRVDVQEMPDIADRIEIR